MKSLKSSGRWVLFFGDLSVFLLSLWLSLFLRTFSTPSQDLFITHLIPFSALFAVWILIFYISGLYERHIIILWSKLPSRIITTQLVNAGMAVLFFYFIPLFGITP